jgi:hypothetical protein
MNYRMRKEQILGMLGRNPKCDIKFYTRIDRMDADSLENKRNSEACMAHRFASEVLTEIDRVMAFTKFKFNKAGGLFGECSPNIQVEDLVVRYFHQKYALFVIIIRSHRGTYLFGPEFESVVRTSEPIEAVMSELTGMAGMEAFSDLDVSPHAWEALYKSQYIPQRKNLRLFYQLLPKRYQRLEGLSVEKGFFNRSLEEFATA